MLLYSLLLRLTTATTRLGRSSRRTRDAVHAEAGQATAEYALVLLGVAAIAAAIGVWATKSGLVGDLLDGVFKSLLGRTR